MLSGGELPAMILMDAIRDLVPGCTWEMDNRHSKIPFSDGLLDFPLQPSEGLGWQASFPQGVVKW